MENLHFAAAIAVILIATTTCCLHPFVLGIVRRMIHVAGGERGVGSIGSTLNAEAPPFRPDEYFTRRQQSEEKGFPQFLALTEDIMVHILSFVADAPFETNSNNSTAWSHVSTLTHSLPYVSKQFRRLVTNRECFWEDAILRQISLEPALWGRHGMMQLLPPSAERQQQFENCKDAKELVNHVKASLAVGRDEESVRCDELYRRVLNTAIRFVGPVFYMRHPLRLGEPYGLHFFEPRYRRLIAEVMHPFPASAKEGGPIVCDEGQPPPLFIHAHRHHLTRSSPACLVQVIRCRIHPGDGRADVFLLPIGYVNLERVWEEPNTGHLYHAQCIRVGQRVTEVLERGERGFPF